MTRSLLPIALPALLALSAPPLSAWQDAVTTLKPGPHLHAAPMHLSFQVNWDGKINSAKVDFLFGKPDKRYPDHHIAQLYGGSIGPAKALFPYRYNFLSFVRKKDYRPVAFSASEEDRDERRETTNHFGSTVRSKEVTLPFRKGKASKTKTGTFSFKRAPVYDLLSAFLYVRSLDLKVHQEIVLVLHPFTEPYLARIKILGREVHRGLNCLKMSLQLQKIGPKMNLVAYDKMKTATMWLSDDRERLPIELRTEVFIGDVRAILVGKKYL